MVLMAMMFFILLLPISSYTAAVPILIHEWDLNNVQTGAIFSAYLIGYVISAILIIPLTDRISSGFVLILSAMLFTLSHLVFALWVDNIHTAFVVRMIGGVGLVGVYMPGVRLIVDRFPGKMRGISVGIFVTAQYFANSCSLLISSSLIGTYAWRDAYLIIAFISSIGVLLALILFSKTINRSSTEESGKFDVKVLRNPSVRYLILGYSLHALNLFSVRVWLPIFLVSVLISQGISEHDATIEGSTLGGIALLVGSIGPLIGGTMSDRFGRAVSASYILTLSALCAFILGWLVNSPIHIILIVGSIYSWSVSADSAIYSTGITEVSPGNKIGSSMALQATFGLIGGVIGPIIVGGILDFAPTNTYWLSGFSLLGFVAIIGILAMQRMRYLNQHDR